MKRTLTLLLAIFITVTLISQSPQRLSYQAVIRNSSGQVVANKSVGMRISILQGSATGAAVYTETHTSVSNASGIVSIEIGGGTPVTGTFSSIDWSTGTYFVKTETDTEGGSSYTITGTSQLLSVPFSFMADKANKATVAEKLNNPVDKLQITGQTDNLEEALFEIKNKNGQTVFAVYNEGVRIFVDNGSSKGSKGGFAIGGFGSSKAPSQDLFVVNPDSIRAYVNTEPTVKGSKGGFAIGGFSNSKAGIQDLFIVNPDSIRAYIATNPSGKGSKGGFAIGGFGSSKATSEEYLRVTRDSTRVYLNDESSKGKKGGFAVGGFGNSKNAETDYLFLNSDSTRFYVRQLGDMASSFDIIGFDLSQQRKSLFQAGPDTVNIQGVLSVQNNLVVAGNVETSGEVQQVGSLTDNSGNTYKTIKIGIQEWMVENLRTTKYNDGSDIPVETDNTAWSLLSTGAYSDYENNPANVAIYGRLYNWHAVNTNLLCPTGWHVPTDAEWVDFNMYLTNNGYGFFEGSPEIAKAIASTTLWAPSLVPPGPGNNPQTNNKTGFNALPAGQRNPDGTFTELNFGTTFWTMSSGGSFDALSNGLRYDQGMLMNQTHPQVAGFSVRCIKGVYTP